MRPRRYTEDALAGAVASSLSFRQVLNKLGLVEAGGNYATVQRAIREAGLSTEHFLGRRVRHGRTFGPRQPLGVYLNNGLPITSHKLKLCLIAESVLPHRCARCAGEAWMGAPIPLELHHRNGDHADNRLENVELLCPNCHAQTGTYRRPKNTTRGLSSGSASA